MGRTVLAVGVPADRGRTGLGRYGAVGTSSVGEVARCEVVCIVTYHRGWLRG